eukprot:Rmarinus@m.3725
MAQHTSTTVVARFRPFNDLEKGYQANDHRSKEPVKFLDRYSVWVEPGGEFAFDKKRVIEGQQFTFDRIFQPDTAQEMLYNEVAKHVVSDVCAGYNGTIFVYGQTGAGKTFSMYGVLGKDDKEGVTPRAARDVFDFVATSPANVQFAITCSFLEIYNENIRDLLNPAKKSLRVRESPTKGCWVEDLTEEFVTNSEEVFQLIDLGERNRSVGCTNMNEHSSRSHTLFCIKIQQKTESGTKTGKLNLVDLAGSERVGKSGATGQKLKEAQNINKSLSALGKCIYTLSGSLKETHVPYRDSKLTRLLKDSLGGNTRTTLIVACSPHAFNVEETISTLKFAQRAKLIKNSAKLNAERPPEDLRTLVETLQRDLEILRVHCSRLEKEKAELTRENDELRQRSDPSATSTQQDAPPSDTRKKTLLQSFSRTKTENKPSGSPTSPSRIPAKPSARPQSSRLSPATSPKLSPATSPPKGSRLPTTRGSPSTPSPPSSSQSSPKRVVSGRAGGAASPVSASNKSISSGSRSAVGSSKLPRGRGVGGGAAGGPSRLAPPTQRTGILRRLSNALGMTAPVHNPDPTHSHLATPEEIILETAESDDETVVSDEGDSTADVEKPTKDRDDDANVDAMPDLCSPLEIAELKLELEKARQAWQAEVDDLKEELEQLRDECSAKESRIATLEKEEESLRKEKETLRKEWKVQNEKASLLEDKAKTHQARVHQLTSELQQSRTLLSARDRTSSGDGTPRGPSTSETLQLLAEEKRKCADMLCHNVEMEQELTSARLEVSAALAESSLSQAQVSELESKLAATQAELKKAKEDLGIVEENLLARSAEGGRLVRPVTSTTLAAVRELSNLGVGMGQLQVLKSREQGGGPRLMKRAFSVFSTRSLFGNSADVEESVLKNRSVTLDQ